MTQRIFITGGNSFLGHHLLPLLQEAKIEYLAPRSNTVDLLWARQINNAIGDYKPTAILHLAALCAGIGGNKNNPAEFVWQNTMMGLNLFRAAQMHNIPKVYCLGSVCMYPVNCPTPFKEADILNGAEEQTNKPYGDAKRLLLSLSEAFRLQYGIGGAFLVPVNLFGPEDHFDPINSHVIPALIRKFVEAKRTNAPQVKCWGTGNATREFLYASDLAQALTKVIQTNFDYELPINFGTGKEISIYDLAHLIKELTNYTGEIVFSGEVSDGQPKRRLDVSRAKEVLNWEATTSLRDGLVKTINWFEDQYDNPMLKCLL
jgi:GDP-L-fucose synthase